ncbi:MAG TPA: SUMF1/EgtB/PvdO family nonheme iron enzyme [Thermoguttaceae bacterium]|nr:SUMF1/EgtB/PvdO family nonheme iron enzyme [Thermoguttaceae bacterium]
MRGKLNRSLLLAAVVVLAATAAQAVTIDLVPVGNPGNAADNTGHGAVGEVYQIGKYEVTNAQWRELLNAKAALGDPYGLYNTCMADVYGGISRSGAGTVADPYVYTAKGGDSNWDNRPVNYVSFWDAARFCNWLHNGQGDGNTESGAYINIGNQTTFARQGNATWFIPTEDEWYKAAYHKNDGVTGNYFDYPTCSDASPSNDLINPDPGNNANFYISGGDYTIGSPYYQTEVGEFENSESPYGTFDQGGNLGEWNETAIDSSRGLRGGRWAPCSLYLWAGARHYGDPTRENNGIGFRVASVPEPGSSIEASVPEPGSITLLLCGLVNLICLRRRK